MTMDDEMKNDGMEMPAEEGAEMPEAEAEVPATDGEHVEG